jgi:1-phosphatidylinositol phosphodiesterase
MRAFDLRVGIAPDGTTVGFFHAAAVLSTSATLADVMYGFYTFLHANPSETLVLSVKVDNTTWGTPAQLQQELHQYFTAYPARAFFVDGDSLGTLGAARGKITLLRRFDLSLLPANESRALGLDVSSGWADNDAGFSITYDVPRNKSVYIEDYYEIGGPAGTASKVQWKYNATAAHLAKAAHEHEDSLFVTFASAEQDYDVPPEYPRVSRHCGERCCGRLSGCRSSRWGTTRTSV